MFDASYNHDAATKIMDSTEGSGTPDFETEFKVYKQTNPLDFTVRSNVFTSGSGSNNPTDGGCWWKLRKEPGFFRSWSKLCTITGVQPGDTYLVNVRTNTVGAANEAGNNGYAIEAVLNGNRYANPARASTPTPTWRSPTRTTAHRAPATAPSTWPRSARSSPGKTLVIEMFDAGDSTGAGISTVYPMKPSPTVAEAIGQRAQLATASSRPRPTRTPTSTRSDLRIHTGERRVTVADRTRQR